MDTVLITTSSFGADRGVELLLQRVRDKGIEVASNPYGRTLSAEELLSLITEFDPVGIIAGVEPINGAALGRAGKLKVISRCGIDTGNVDMESANRLGIKIVNTPDAPTEAVAEFTVALILNLIRRISESDRIVRAGGWKKLSGRSLSGMAVGIIGCGRIGSHVAAYLSAFGCGILGTDKVNKNMTGVKMVPIDVLMKESDVITFHVPAVKENINMVNDSFISAMKEGSFIINASRGEIIDEDALVRGLETKKIAGAALDTFRKEPYKGRLCGFDNVLLTSHMGSYAKEARIKMEIESILNLLKGLEGQR